MDRVVHGVAAAEVAEAAAEAGALVTDPAAAGHCDDYSLTFITGITVRAEAAGAVTEAAAAAAAGTGMRIAVGAPAAVARVVPMSCEAPAVVRMVGPITLQAIRRRFTIPKGR